MVVRVVVKDRTDGAGEEKVLSPPFRESKPPPAVRLVPVIEDAICDGAWMECAVSGSVECVGAVEWARAAREAPPFVDERIDARL